MEEFSQAYHEVMEGRLHYLVVVLLQHPIHHDLPPELETYLKTHTYIDAKKYPNNIETIRKAIRFAMPKTPLRHLQVSVHLDFQFYLPSFSDELYNKNGEHFQAIIDNCR